MYSFKHNLNISSVPKMECDNKKCCMAPCVLVFTPYPPDNVPVR